MRRLQDRSHSFSSFPEFAPCKGIQDSLGFWILRRGFRIPGTVIPILCPFLSLVDPDSLSCIPDVKAQDSGIHKQKSLGFPYMGRQSH